jgi:hypothetical protein
MIYALLFGLWINAALAVVVWYLNGAYNAEKEEVARLNRLTEHQAKFFQEQLNRVFNNPFCNQPRSNAVNLLN